MYKCYIQLQAICSSPTIWWARATGCLWCKHVRWLKSSSRTVQYLSPPLKSCLSLIWHCSLLILSLHCTIIFTYWQIVSDNTSVVHVCNIWDSLSHKSIWFKQWCCYMGVLRTFIEVLNGFTCDLHHVILLLHYIIGGLHLNASAKLTSTI